MEVGTLLVQKWEELLVRVLVVLVTSEVGQVGQVGRKLLTHMEDALRMVEAVEVEVVESGILLNSNMLEEKGEQVIIKLSLPPMQVVVLLGLLEGVTQRLVQHQHLSGKELLVEVVVVVTRMVLLAQAVLVVHMAVEEAVAVPQRMAITVVQGAQVGLAIAWSSLGRSHLRRNKCSGNYGLRYF